MENDRLDAALSRLYQKTDAPESFETGWRAAVRREESIRMMNKPNRKNMFMKRLVPALTVLVLIAGGLWAGEQNLSAPQTRCEQDIIHRALHQRQFINGFYKRICLTFGERIDLVPL